MSAMTAGATRGRATSTSVLGRLLVAWQTRVVLVFLGSRIVSSIFLLVTMHFADPTAVGTGRTFFTALVDWDGGWYKTIAQEGYPSTLPVADGRVQENAWAFMPLYPLLVRVLILGHLGAYPVAAVAVSAAFGAAAAVMLVLLVRPHVGHRAAVIAAAIFSFGPTSFILQAGYAESMGLFLLFAMLTAVDRQRYRLAALVAVPLAFTRPGMQAVALLVGLHLCARFLGARRAGRPLALRTLLAPVLLAGWCGVLGFVWPLLAWAVTGVKDAYLLTELAWRVGMGFDPVHLTYFTPWLRGAEIWFGAPAGYIILGVALLLAAALPFVPAVRQVGSTVLLWYGAYCLYLVAVFFPQSSTLRLLMPVSPITAPLGRLPGWQVGIVLTVCVALQGLLVWNAFGAPFGMLSTP